MNHDHYDDAYLRDILATTRTVAVVGASANEERPSYGVQRFLSDAGYEVYPVNPGQAGKEILGRPVFASLRDIPVAVDMIDVFRSSDSVGPIVDDAIAIGAKVVWMQLHVTNADAAKKAEAAGLKVVMNRCPKIERSRLFQSA